ncbi:hypothetical protein BH23PLA1_BH23PLA1_10300 [soil metagenome]
MTCQTDTSPVSLDLPREFEDLAGLLEIDLKAIASALTHRAHERLLLTRREYHQLHRDLLDNLSRAINESLEPLSADLR